MESLEKAASGSNTDINSMDSDYFSSSEPAASSACHVCQGFGDLSNPRGFAERLKPAEQMYWPPADADCEYVYIYLHHPNIGVLLASAEAGCDGCNVLSNSLREYHNNDLEAIAAMYQPAQGSKPTPIDIDTQAATEFAEVMMQDRAFITSRFEHYDNGRVVLLFPCCHEFGPRARSNHNSRLLVRVLTTPLLIGMDVIFINSLYDPLDPEQQHRPCRDLLSSPHIGLINRWKDACKSEHTSCNRAGYKQPLPSRVLELSHPGDDESVCGVRLVETHERMRGEYACLSYCWGDSEVHNLKGQTTKLNLPNQLQDIALDSLPKTIIDTVYLCFKLGYQFLWVDRLCIIQDDEEDWKREASIMCDIYSRSALTISVPLCVESSESFLRKRLDTHGFDVGDKSATINYIDESSKGKACLYLTRGGLCRNKASWFLEGSWKDFTGITRHEGTRWLCRGWTFQEWMLSARVLHIDTMTLWDCFDGYANELNRRYPEKPRLLRDPESFGEGISWDFIVKEYTARDITYKKDKLPALAGLAARYSQITGHRYLVGLWFEEMPRSLLWRRGHGALQKLSGDDRMADSRPVVPSWSWASTDDKIIYDVGFIATATAESSFLSDASVYRCSDHPNSISTKEKTWIDIKGHIGVVTDQDMLGLFWNRPKSRIKGGNEWWISIPDRELDYPSEAIAQSRLHLLILGSSSNIVLFHGFYGDSSDGESGDGDDESSDAGNSQYGSHYGGSSNNADSDDANIDGTRSGRSSIESCSDGSDPRRAYGALVLERDELIDGRQCFRRLGIAFLNWTDRLNVQDGPLWELQDVRLI